MQAIIFHNLHCLPTKYKAMKKILLLAIITLVTFGCASNSDKENAKQEQANKNQLQEVDPNAPDWYNNPPTSDTLVFGVGVGTSRDMSIAERKAIMQANLNLAEQITQPIVDENKTSTEATLSNISIVQKVWKKEGAQHNVYILISMKK